MGDMTMKVRLFDKLELTDGTVTLTEAEMHSEQLGKLLAYLIIHREVGCSASQLVDVLWDNSSANPINSLKNLIYRLRKQLAVLWPDRELILTGKSLYQWNNAEAPVELDTETFDRSVMLGLKEHDPERKQALLAAGIALYRGRYLSSFEWHQGVLFHQTYYHNQYIEAVTALAECYEGEMAYDEMEQLCERALLVEPMEERFHCLLLKAYIGKNRLSMAERHYHEAIELLGDHLGEDTTNEMRAIYRQLMEQQHSREMDLNRISKELLLYSEERKSAFYCQYGVFQHIYELEARRRERMDYPLSLVLISVYAESLETAEEDVEQENAAMKRLMSVLGSKLRHGDIYTKYSNTQFLVMLTNCPKENVDVVMNHVLTGYYRESGQNRRSRKPEDEEVARIQYSALAI